MIPKIYSLENLRKLMAESPAYNDLPPESKDNIEEHIKQNNESVLLYVFQQLRDEARSHEQSREELAHKLQSFASDEAGEVGKNLKDHLND